jgi:hypothetical protein
MRIRQSVFVYFCAHCLNFAKFKHLEQDNIQYVNVWREFEPHKIRYERQSEEYRNTNQRLEAGELNRTVVVVMDFTKYNVNMSYVEDLIIVIYSYDADAEENLKKRYFPFLSSSQTNDHLFVAACWIRLFNENVFKDIDTIMLYSDGGRKHFKCTVTIEFFSWFSQFEQINIVYNFFESYHGHSACDGCAANSKKKIKTFQLEQQIQITTDTQIADVLSSIRNSTSQICPDTTKLEPHKPKTFAAISTLSI